MTASRLQQAEHLLLEIDAALAAAEPQVGLEAAVALKQLLPTDGWSRSELLAFRGKLLERTKDAEELRSRFLVTLRDHRRSRGQLEQYQSVGRNH